MDCNGNRASGVKIKAWDTTCTTGNNGTCIIYKNRACQDSVGGGDQLATSVVAGKDADSAQPHYYSRVDSPSFTRESCTTINCNYTGSPLTSSPARQAYYISAPTDDSTAQENQFIRKACSMDDGDANAGYDFKQINGCEKRPDAKISNVGNLKYGETLTWTVEATDADGNLESTGIYYDRGEPAIGAASWVPLKWVGSQNASALTYKHSDNNGVAPWVCNAGNQGTWTLATNAKDKTGLECSGDPTGSATRCASGLS